MVLRFLWCCVDIQRHDSQINLNLKYYLAALYIGLWKKDYNIMIHRPHHTWCPKSQAPSLTRYIQVFSSLFSSQNIGLQPKSDIWVFNSHLQVTSEGDEVLEKMFWVVDNDLVDFYVPVACGYSFSACFEGLTLGNKYIVLLCCPQPSHSHPCKQKLSKFQNITQKYR